MLNNELQIFVTVAEKENFSRAAEALNLSQPAISQHINNLEAYYGVKLFERSSKKVQLTQAGSTLYKYAKDILDMHIVAKRAVADLVELVTGKLTIGASLTIGEYVLPRLLAAFSKKYPEVKLSVDIGNTEEMHEKILDGSIDIGLVEGELEDPHLEIKEFLEDELVFVVSRQHPLAGRNVVEDDDLRNYIFILREEGSGTRHAMESALQKLSFVPSNQIVLGSTQAIKEAVEAGLGISCLSKWTLRKELQLGSLKPMRIKDSNVKRKFYLVSHKGKFESKATSEFEKFIFSNDIKSM
ncbi:MAG: LysR family transcriptional regulator [Clostridiales bacterium]|nr:LysR family transcriptional regulator [Clostridiales bacterium]MCF8021892.1 LysR family transcriptional regulator [Clostridiales bacterium]